MDLAQGGDPSPRPFQIKESFRFFGGGVASKYHTGSISSVTETYSWVAIHQKI